MGLRVNELELMEFVQVSVDSIRTMRPPPNEEYHVTWTVPIADYTTDRDVEMAQQELSRRFPNWTVEVLRVHSCAWTY